MTRYYDIIQAYFVRLTGTMAIFSARDMALLERWRDAGASAGAICRGLREAALRWPASSPPRSLHQCRDWIEPHVARARRLGACEPPRPMAAGRADPIARALDAIERAGRAETDARRRAVYRGAWCAARQLPPDDAWRALAAVEDAMAAAYLEALDAPTRARIKRRLRAERPPNGLGDAAAARHAAERRRALLVREYGLAPIVE